MWSIIKSHFHKGKTGFIITGLFVILSVFMMIIGLSICLGMDNLYYNARNLSNSPDLGIAIYKNSEFCNQVIDKLVSESGKVEKYDKTSSIYYSYSKDDKWVDYLSILRNEGGNYGWKSFWMQNIDAQNDAFKPHIRKEVKGEGFKLYITGNTLATTNIEIGNIVKFYYNNTIVTGYVAGVFDSACAIYQQGFYVSGDFYDYLLGLAKNDSDFRQEDVINLRFKYENESECRQIIDDFANQLINEVTKHNLLNPTNIGNVNTMSRMDFTDGTSSFIFILGAALIAFSVIIAVIVSIVIGFLVRSSVMDEVRNLGVQKSLGYTTNTLRLGYLAIYGVIASICMLVGILLGICLMPTFVNLITSMARLDCSKAIGLNVGSIFVGIALIVLVIGTVVMVATGRIKRVTPLSAMRNNLDTHSFKKNHVPLAKSKMPINVGLGIKSVTGEVSRSVMVVVVVLIMSLLCSFVSVIFYNLKVDQTAIINMSAIEVPDWQIGFSYDNKEDYYNAIRNMDGYLYDTHLDFRCDGYDGDRYTRMTWFEDMSKRRTDMLYEGRYPKYDNEILMNIETIKQGGYNIGDTITIEFNSILPMVEKQFVIVGTFQSIVNYCHTIGIASAVYDIVDKSGVDLSQYKRYFYFEAGKNPTREQIVAQICNTMKQDSVRFNGFQSGRSMIENHFLNTVETAADAVMSVFIAITVIVITLLLVMLVKLKLLREKRNYAIYKALGYTTPNIMSQIAVAMVFLGVIGSLVGSIVGALITSPLLSGVGGLIGMGKFAFVIPWGYIVGVIVLIPLLIYLVSMLCAVPVRRIAPATLLRERG